MPDGVNVDFGLLKPVPDMVSGYANAYRTGQALGKESAVQNANALYAQNPGAGINAMTAIDPAQGAALQGLQNNQADRQSTIAQAMAEGQGDIPGAIGAAASRGATGDVATLRAQLDAIPGQQKAAAVAAAQQKNEQLAHVLMGLKGYPPEQRLPIAQHLAQQTGLLDPASITADDVSDQGINAHLASAMTVEQFLKSSQADAELAERQREFNAKAAAPVYHWGQPGEVATMVSGGAAPSGAPGTPSGPVNATPQDLDAMARAAIGEAEGEGPQGQAAVMHTVLNRARANPSQTIAAIVHAPGQFDGISSPRAAIPTSDPKYQAALALAQDVAGGKVPDPTGGATNFDNPQLQAQQGRPPPSFATGAGVRIGNHVFYGGGGGSAPAPGGLPTQVGQSTTVGGPGAGTPPGDATKTGPAYLATLPPGLRSQVQQIIDGRAPYPANPRTPAQFQLSQAATQADPTLNAATFPERAKSYSDSFATNGKSALAMKALNTALDHAGHAYDLVSQLRNNDTPLIGDAINAFKNATDTKSRSLAPQLAVTIQKLGIEAAAASQGGQPHEGEVKGFLSVLRDPNSQPTEQRGALKGLVDVLAQQLKETGTTYDRSRSPAGTPFLGLSPDAQAAAAKINGLQAKLGGRSVASTPNLGPNRATPTGAGHLTDAQIRAQLGL